MINIACIEGRLTKDPISLNKKNGDSYLKFWLAHSSMIDPSNPTDYYECICFEKKQVTYIKRYFKKGCLVLVKGKLHTYKYQDPTGSWIQTTSIILDYTDGASLLKEPRDKSTIKQEIGIPGGKLKLGDKL